MRTFVALELSDEIKRELSRLQDELRSVGADIKWVNPENIHLTLKFLGEIEESKINQIKESLDSISAVNKSFDMSLFKLGAFPNLNYPRVIWVGIDKNCSEVERLVKLVEEALSKIGFSSEDRPYSAHLTLGRVKSGKNKSELKEKLSALEAQSISCVIDKIILFKSALTPKGPIYSPLVESNFMG